MADESPSGLKDNLAGIGAFVVLILIFVVMGTGALIGGVTVASWVVPSFRFINGRGTLSLSVAVLVTVAVYVCSSLVLRWVIGETRQWWRLVRDIVSMVALVLAVSHIVQPFSGVTITVLVAILVLDALRSRHHRASAR